MARASRDLAKHQKLLLLGGFAVYLTAMVAAALISVGLSAREDAVARQEQARKVEPRAPGDLLRTPEVVIKPIAPNGQARQEIAQLVQKIRVQDQMDADGFVKDLIRSRPDLQGLPFQMGGACRMTAQTSDAFGMAVGLTHESLRAQDFSSFQTVDPVGRFFDHWGGQDTTVGVAALTQIYGPQTQSRREGLAKHLKTIDNPAATKALAKTAVFDFDEKVRLAAVDGLKKRTKQDYTEVLLTALRHPWPAVAEHAARAIVRLQRQDLAPQLVAFLAESNPHDPFETVVNGENKMVVREMVKINHHKNCLLCHAPAQVNAQPGGVLAVVPTPGESFAPPSSGGPYGGSPGDPMIRADVTYLRQDFSILASVANAQPWPEMQRFDFMVRNRVLTDEEIRTHLKEKQARALGELSENQKAAADALRRLTGKAAAPNAVAWADALDLPVPQLAKQQ